jgi:TPP-dependent indolepyruvate ferredoxin oxidoreductase alpha subunit
MRHIRYVVKAPLGVAEPMSDDDVIAYVGDDGFWHDGPKFAISYEEIVTED